MNKKIARSLFLCLCDVSRVPVNSLVCCVLFVTTLGGQER